MPVLDGGGAPGVPSIPNFLPDTDWMSGSVTSYNSVTGALVASIVTKSGTATYTAWNISRAPTPGTSSIVVGTSTTSLAIGTGTKNLTIETGLDLQTGDLIFIIYQSAAGMNAVGMILYLAASQLQDTTGQKWDVSVLVPYLNLFLLEVMNLKPDAYAVTQNLTLVAGVAQSLPTDAIALVDVISNMGATGTSRGPEISSIDKGMMDDFIPGWMAFTADPVVRYVVTDDRNPKKFHVFPPQTSSPVKIEVVITTPPLPITESYWEFPFDDSYIPAGIDYVIYRALAEETSQPNTMAKSTMYFNKFMQDLGLKSNVEKQQDEKGK
jgi:hypothetical protein